jgi:hypothetical protein
MYEAPNAIQTAASTAALEQIQVLPLPAQLLHQRKVPEGLGSTDHPSGGILQQGRGD